MIHRFSGRTESLDGARIFVQTRVGFFKQTVQDINYAPPILVDGVHVGKSRTYNFRTRSRIAQKTFRKTQKARILLVNLGADR